MDSGLPRWFRGKDPACKAGDMDLILGSGRSPGEANGYPFQYSCLRNPMDRGPWQATIGGVTKELDTTERLKTTPATWTRNQLFRAFSLHVNIQKRIAIYLGVWWGGRGAASAMKKKSKDRNMAGNRRQFKSFEKVLHSSIRAFNQSLLKPIRCQKLF